MNIVICRHILYFSFHRKIKCNIKRLIFIFSVSQCVGKSNSKLLARSNRFCNTYVVCHTRERELCYRSIRIRQMCLRFCLIYDLWLRLRTSITSNVIGSCDKISNSNQYQYLSDIHFPSMVMQDLLMLLMKMLIEVFAKSSSRVAPKCNVHDSVISRLVPVS